MTMNRKKLVKTPDSSPKPPDTPGALVDVFISYARADAVIAKNLAETLRSEGFEVWFDEKIYAGADWNSMLMSTLSSAKAILVLWSRQSVDRSWVLKEAKIAKDSNRLVSAKIDDCTLPKQFSGLQAAMMPGWSGAGHHPELERLLDGVSRLAPPSRVDTVRPGYDTGFLGFEVDLPSVAGVAEEFRYLHFSVVMNPARRLAWYVAYNMQPHTAVERSDKWMPDPMLPASFQLQHDDFRNSGLDRGHMISPMSVSWGTPRQAELANHQSFFWTNTVPQHQRMNQGWWLAVEKWERELTITHHKAIGFSGPVLAEDDPIHRDLERTIGRLRVRQNFRLPRRFWKVVVVAAPKGKLKSAAFVMDQDSLVKNKVPLHSKASEFRCGISDIEELTGLDFGTAVRSAPTIP